MMKKLLCLVVVMTLLLTVQTVFAENPVTGGSLII